MRIFIEDNETAPLFEAIETAPFSPAFKAAFIDEILSAPGLRFGAAGILGFFVALADPQTDLLDPPCPPPAGPRKRSLNSRRRQTRPRRDEDVRATTA